MVPIRLIAVALIALALSCGGAKAQSQCNGTFPAGSVCGNLNGGPPGQVPFSSFISPYVPLLFPGQIVANYTGGSAVGSAQNWMYSNNSGSCPFNNLTIFQLYADNSALPTIGLNMFDGFNCARLFSVNQSTHIATLLAATPTVTLTSAAPTVAASQIGLGSTTVAAGAATCPTGTVGGQTVQGCVVINVAGTTRYLPFF